MDEASMVWLGTWEPIDCVGRHSRVYPAGFATGYKFRQPEGRFERRQQRFFDRDLRMRGPVSRAIPVEGTVSDPVPTWKKAPQARFWLEPEHVPVMKRIMKWLKGEM